MIPRGFEAAGTITKETSTATALDACRDPLPRRRVIPIGEQRPKRCDKSERLIEHDVMLGLGDLDHGRRATQKVEHIFADLGRHEDGILAPEYGDAALGSSKPRGGSDFVATPAQKL